MSPNLSNAQLLNFLQCPRRFWLEQYHPEREGDVSTMDEVLDAEEAAHAIAHEKTTGDSVRKVSGRLGIRNALEQTRTMLEPGAIVLDATFEHNAISTRVDVLDWSGTMRRAISATAATQLSQPHIENCSIQAWIMRGLELPEHRFIVALSKNNRESDQDFESCFDLHDVTERALSILDRIDETVTEARRLHAALDEPDAATGPRCHLPGYACPFLDYCDQR